jgi:hypothetical protein
MRNEVCAQKTRRETRFWLFGCLSTGGGDIDSELVVLLVYIETRRMSLCLLACLLGSVQLYVVSSI